jgi:stringent starvation protein B
MAFEVGSDDLASDALEVPETEPEGAVDENPEPPRPDGGRPKLQRIK